MTDDSGSYEVLFFDDIPSAAQTYAAAISMQTGFRCVGVERPEEARRVVEKNPVHVVVLDQIIRGSTMTGTELFQRLKRMDSYLKAIMLTGEAGRGDAAEALAIGYSAIIDKAIPVQFDTLPPRIQVLRLEYRRDKGHLDVSLQGDTLVVRPQRCSLTAQRFTSPKPKSWGIPILTSGLGLLIARSR